MSLQECRKSVGLTQSALADMVGVKRLMESSCGRTVTMRTPGWISCRFTSSSTAVCPVI